jgi:hypothetical protein
MGAEAIRDSHRVTTGGHIEAGGKRGKFVGHGIDVFRMGASKRRYIAINQGLRPYFETFCITLGVANSAFLRRTCSFPHSEPWRGMGNCPLASTRMLGIRMGMRAWMLDVAIAPTPSFGPVPPRRDRRDGPAPARGHSSGRASSSRPDAPNGRATRRALCRAARRPL